MTVGKVITEASMSLDGFIAKQDNTIGRLFDWLQNGDLERRVREDALTGMTSNPTIFERAISGSTIAGRSDTIP